MSDLFKKIKIFTSSLIGGSSSATWGSITGSISSQTDLQNSLNTKENTANKGVAGGYPSLDASGKIPTSQLPPSVIGAAVYQGTWDASLNSPLITSSVGTKGYYYVVNTAGSTNIDSITDWKLGDWIIFNGTIWEKVDNTDSVISVNGYTGAVTLTKSDIGLSNVDNTSDSNKPISSATQTALNNKQDLDSDLTTISAINSTNSGVLASDGSGWIMKTYNSLKSALGLTKSDVGLSNVVNTDTTTTSNITDSTNKRFVTDSDLTTLSNTSGINTGDETNASILTKLNLNSGTVNIDFGNDGQLTENDLVITTVSAPWITATTKINCFVENDGVDHSDEDVYLENIIATVYNIVPNTSFDIIAVAHNLTWGKYKITYKQII
jgi:hypothetical protein